MNRKEAEIVRLLFDLYLMNIGCSRLSDLLNYLGVKTMTDSQCETGTIGGMLSNEKYKGDFHLQKYYTPSTQRNVTRRNRGEVQSYYMGCSNRHVEEETLVKAYLMAWNALVENREAFMERWKEQMQSENLLEGYRAEKFIEYTDGVQPLTEMDADFMLKTLDYIKVFENGTLLVVFLDGTEIECRSEKE